LKARADDGTSVAVPAPELYDTEAATAPPPDVGDSVNVDVVIVPAFIGSLNVTTTLEFTGTLVAAFNGFTAVTVGGVTSLPAMVKLLVNGGFTPLPARSFAPEVTDTI
jgi:hypothetical protein